MTALELTGTSKPTTYHFRPAQPPGGWALCTVNDATGELCITSDWGNFAYRWDPNPRSLGAPSLTEFIGRRHEDDVDYLAAKLNRDSDEFDHDATVKAFCKLLCEQRLRDGRRRILLGTWRPIPSLIARSLWDEMHDMDDCGTCSDLFLERFLQIDGHSYITEEPWNELVIKQTGQDKVLREVILPALINACKATLDEPPPVPPVSCQHLTTSRGEDAPRLYGSWRTVVCVRCKSFRLTDHHGKARGGWKPASEYAAAVAPEQDE